MRYDVVLNRNGGTLRSVDVAGFCKDLERVFGDRGHQVKCHPVDGRELDAAMRSAFTNDRSDAVIVAGGDGTASFAASMAWKEQKPMGLIPAGTMNLFARSLGTPLEITSAAEALAESTVVRVDIATADKRPFLHQFSVGFHPRVIRLRNSRKYNSRFDKIRASVLSVLDTLRRPPVFPAKLKLDGAETGSDLTSISISNNPYGDGHLPYADTLDTGLFGVYTARPASTASTARLLTDLALGTWRNNPDIREQTAREVEIEFPRMRRDSKAVIDGELIDLADRVEFTMNAGALPILKPRQSPTTERVGD